MELGVSTSAEPGDDGERVPLTPSRGGGDGGWDSALPGLAATEADTKKARNKAKLQRFAAAASFADGGDDEEDSGRRYDDPTQAPPVGDARRTREAKLLLGVYVLAVLPDAVLYIPEDALATGIEAQERDLAELGQAIAQALTAALGVWSLGVLWRWQKASPRYAHMAAMQFALLPELAAICLVLDIGKLAYPVGLRLPLTMGLIFLRLVSIVLVLRLSLNAGRATRTGSGALPEMLRTLIQLESVEADGMKQLGVQRERPLSVDLLDRLIVFFTPRRVGATRAGAGLARSAVIPITAFLLVLTTLSSAVEYNRLRGTQAPWIDTSAAETMAAAAAADPRCGLAANFSTAARYSSDTTTFEMPFAPQDDTASTFVPSPPRVWVAVVSGLQRHVADDVFGRLFSEAQMCTEDKQGDRGKLSKVGRAIAAQFWRQFWRHFWAQFWRNSVRHPPTPLHPPPPPVRGLRRRLRAADALGAELARSAHRRVAGDPRHRRQRRRPAVPVRLGVQAGGGARRPRGHRRESVDGQPGEAVAPAPRRRRPRLVECRRRVRDDGERHDGEARRRAPRGGAPRRAPRAVRLGRIALRRRDGQVLALRDAPHQRRLDRPPQGRDRRHAAVRRGGAPREGPGGDADARPPRQHRPLRPLRPRPRAGRRQRRRLRRRAQDADVGLPEGVGRRR